MRSPISKTRIIWRICSTGIRCRVTEWAVSDVQKHHGSLMYDGTDVRTSRNILPLKDKWITIFRNVVNCSASDVTPYPSSTDLSVSHHYINNQIAAWSRSRHASGTEMDDYKTGITLSVKPKKLQTGRPPMSFCASRRWNEVTWDLTRVSAMRRQRRPAWNSGTGQILDRRLWLWLLYWQIIDISTNCAAISFVRISPFTNSK